MKKKETALEKYKDIIHLPHYVSSKRTQMSLTDRAAQFAPFAAVVGHNDATKEAARHTDQRRGIGEQEKSIIADQIREARDLLASKCNVEIVYFRADALKSGGRYVTQSGTIKKIDMYERKILMTNGASISIDDIDSINIEK